jgi:hypothetical protein
LAVLPLSLLALMLIPGRQEPSILHEQARFDALNDLQAAGYELRARWLKQADLPLSDHKSMGQWEVHRDTMIWMAQCREKLKPFPELAGILAAQKKQPDPMDDLEVSLQTLSRLRRLVSLSRSLKLPI